MNTYERNVDHHWLTIQLVILKLRSYFIDTVFTLFALSILKIWRTIVRVVVTGWLDRFKSCRPIAAAGDGMMWS